LRAQTKEKKRKEKKDVVGVKSLDSSLFFCPLFKQKKKKQVSQKERKKRKERERSSFLCVEMAFFVSLFFIFAQRSRKKRKKGKESEADEKCFFCLIVCLFVCVRERSLSSFHFEFCED
jgi:hypothetical protein